MTSKNLFAKAALPSLSMILTWGLNPVHGMEIDALHDEVLASSLKQLKIKDLGLCAQVCHKWNQVSSDDNVWEEAAQKYELSGGKFHEFSHHLLIFDISWKEILEKNYLYWDKLKKEAAVIEKKAAQEAADLKKERTEQKKFALELAALDVITLEESLSLAATGDYHLRVGQRMVMDSVFRSSFNTTFQEIKGEKWKAKQLTRERNKEIKETIQQLFHDYKIKTPDLPQYCIKKENEISIKMNDCIKLLFHEYKLPDIIIERINLFIPKEIEKHEITIEGINLTEISPGKLEFVDINNGILHNYVFPTEEDEEDEEIKIEEFNPIKK
ncbi:MAG: F-box protein [Alphaproteobacteria bacterium]|nr:F-box protein [Alphaproteobacteria bacterium]